MDPHKEGRWKELFEMFEKSLTLLETYIDEEQSNVLEIAGLIHFHEMCLEHARKTLIAYLDAKGVSVSTSRQAVKESAKHLVISNESQWHRAFNRKNLVHFLFTEKVKKELLADIQQTYYPMYKEFQRTLSEL